MKCNTKHTCVRWGAACLLAIGLLLVAGCARTHDEEGTLLISPVATVASQLSVGPSAMPLPTAGPVSLVILHTNDNWGETEPCGWGASSTGGFRRRATLIEDERAASDQILVLDTGDALRGGGILGDTTDGEAVVAAMSLVGTDAMALGLNELSLGSTALRLRMAEATFPMLSANVTLTGTSELFAPAYVVVEIGGHSVGLLGLTRRPARRVADFRVQDPYAAVATVVPELMKQTETIILVTNLEYRPAMDLAASVPNIDLVIAANPGQLPTSVVALPSTGSLIVAAEQPVARHTGRRIGRLVLTIASDGSLSNREWRSISLDKTLADDPDMAALLDRFRQ